MVVLGAAGVGLERCPLDFFVPLVLARVHHGGATVFARMRTCMARPPVFAEVKPACVTGDDIKDRQADVLALLRGRTTDRFAVRDLLGRCRSGA
jgi:hypothetical protein